MAPTNDDQRLAFPADAEMSLTVTYPEMRIPSPAPVKTALPGSIRDLDTEAYELPVLMSRSNATSALELPQKSEEQKRKELRAERVALCALLFSMFMEGWNDGTSGPMIPAMQKHYKIGFMVVSLIFVVNCLGFVTGAMANIYLSHKYGFGKVLVFGAISQLCAYSIQAPAPPFPAFTFAYFLSGFGVAVQNAHAMVFAVSLDRNSPLKMSLLHAAYGIGALSAPLVATQFAAMPRWSFHYLISMGGAILNVSSLLFVFKLHDLDYVLNKTGQTARQRSVSQDSHYSQILKLKVVHLIAFFVLAYVGVEVTLGGWIVTFVIDERGGGASSGYLSSGFFGGLTIGRLCFLWVNRKVGERRVIWIYILLCIGLEITIWFTPSLIENAIAVSCIGLFMGPIYPIVMNISGRLIPHWLMSGAVGWVAGVGQAGSAFLPFITGIMASKFGVTSLQPLVVSVFVTMLGLWAFVPTDTRRSE